MRRIIVRIGATGAGALLALGLFAGPSAGAAGSDKQSKAESKAERSEKVTCFNDEGHTQGRSLSDPDGMSNGGADKPGCTREGGDPPWNADTDNDGNNGCGNDLDREDDNNGNCRRQPAQGPSNPDGEESQEDSDDTGNQAENAGSDSQLETAGSTTAPQTAEAATTAAPTTVMGASLTAPETTETPTSTTTPDTQVLGETLSAPDTLARTGAGIGGLALLGGLLLGGGRLTVLARRFLRIG